MSKTTTRPAATDTGHMYLAIGAMCWGSGPTIQYAAKEAKRNATRLAGKNQKLHVYFVPAGSYIDGMGRLVSPHATDSCPTCRADNPIEIVSFTKS